MDVMKEMKDHSKQWIAAIIIVPRFLIGLPNSS